MYLSICTWHFSLWFSVWLDLYTLIPRGRGSSNKERQRTGLFVIDLIFPQNLSSSAISCSSPCVTGLIYLRLPSPSSVSFAILSCHLSVCRVLSYWRWLRVRPIGVWWHFCLVGYYWRSCYSCICSRCSLNNDFLSEIVEYVSFPDMFISKLEQIVNGGHKKICSCMVWLLNTVNLIWSVILYSHIILWK